MEALDCVDMNGPMKCFKTIQPSLEVFINIPETAERHGDGRAMGL